MEKTGESVSPKVRCTWVFALLAPVLYGLALLLSCDLNDVLLVGGDDGFELAKSFFLERCPKMTARLWNDQPWLHTVVTASVYRVFGEYAMVPRMLSYLCALAAVAGCAWMLDNHLGYFGSAVLGLLFISFSTVANLSFSAMLEIPAISLATLAGCFAVISFRRQSNTLFFASASLLAVAMNIKFTSAVVIPGIVLTMILAQDGARKTGRQCLKYFGIFIAGLVVVALLSPTFDSDELLGTHLIAAFFRGSADVTGFSPHAKDFLSYPAHLLGAVIFIAASLRRESSRETIFLTSLGATAVLFTVFVRPWYHYYIVQFAIPVSGLAALAVDRGFTAIVRWLKSDWQGDREEVPSRSIFMHVLGFTLVAALWIGFSATSLYWTYDAFSRKRGAQSDVICATMKLYSSKCRWMFSDKRREYSFFARVPIPPELVVLGKKREWATGLKDVYQMNYVRLYKPELLVLTKSYLRGMPRQYDWVRSHYVLVVSEPEEELWISNDIVPNILGERNRQLNVLGL